MRPRLLIIGATGFVGSRWTLAAAEHFDVIGAARHVQGSASSVDIDITDADSVRRALREVRPQWVTHLAAISDIDRCEREKDLAERINVDGTRRVAEACADVGARLLYTSTDAVFDGTRGIYYEGDPPSPPNWYGQTKARAERLLSELLPSALIVRLSLVLGRGANAGGNSYLEKVEGNLRAGRQILTPTFEWRNPIDVGTLCRFFVELIQQQASGIFHVGASDKIARYELARQLAIRLGADPALIVAQDEPVPGRAPRGPDDFLATPRLRLACRTPIPTCDEVIQRALAVAQ
jgi:dTDP-4-dehydrorhamnose reductase